MKHGCLSPSDFATFHFVVNAPVLVVQTPIDFGTARVGDLVVCSSYGANVEGSGDESDKRERVAIEHQNS